MSAVPFHAGLLRARALPTGRAGPRATGKACLVDALSTTAEDLRAHFSPKPRLSLTDEVYDVDYPGAARSSILRRI